MDPMPLDQLVKHLRQGQEDLAAMILGEGEGTFDTALPAYLGMAADLIATMRLTTRRGRPRPPPSSRDGLWAHEIEPGRSVPANWDKELTETWEARKARRARERAASSPGAQP